MQRVHNFCAFVVCSEYIAVWFGRLQCGTYFFFSLLHTYLQLTNYFVAAGLNSIGISSSGGLGRALAQWVVSGHEPMDMWSVDVQRFSPHMRNPQFLLERVSEVAETHYMMPYPRKEFSSGRGLRWAAVTAELVVPPTHPPLLSPPSVQYYKSLT